MFLNSSKQIKIFWKFYGIYKMQTTSKKFICFKVIPKTKIWFCQKPILRQNSRFSLIFKLFFLALLKTIENLISWMHQLDSLSHQTRYCWRKSEQFYFVMRHTNKKTHIIVKSIHLPLRSEYKIILF